MGEIQYVPYWKDIVKRYADQSKRLKFVLSGSQSARLKGTSKESLAGRIIEYDIPPLSLAEHAVIKDGTTVKDGPVLRDILTGAVSPADMQMHIQANRAGYLRNVPIYLCWGQFPQIAGETDAHLARRYVEEAVFGKVVEIDLPQLYGIDNTEAFKAMAGHLTANSGSPFELRNIASDLGISRLTAESYLKYLRAGYVIDVLYRHTRSAVKAGRTLKKGYAYSPNFVAALNRLQPEEYTTRPELFGKVVETYVWQRLSWEYPELTFWRKGTREVDFLVSGAREGLIPVEAKFSSRVRSEELAGLIELCREKQIPDAFVLTKDLAETCIMGGVRVHLLPFYMI